MNTEYMNLRTKFGKVLDQAAGRYNRWDIFSDWAYAERTGKEFVVKSRTHAACDNVYTIQATDGDGSAFFERNLILVKRKGK